MKIKILSLIGGLIILSFFGCQSFVSENTADLVLHNTHIYTINQSQPTAEAVAVSDGKILWVGDNEGAKKWMGEKTEVLDLNGKIVVPGLIESHAHIMGIGAQVQNISLAKTSSYDELIAMVAEAVKETPKGEWIQGRGWHQSKWTPQPEMVKGYQTHEALSAVSPDHPVFLTHASGHAAFANAKAMEIAGITNGMAFSEDGEVIQYPDGRPTGVFSERAASLISRHIPEPSAAALAKRLELAIEECLANGITSFQNAGASQEEVDLFEDFVANDKMKLHMWTMLSGSDSSMLERWYQKGPQLSDFLTVRSIKLYADGALGSRGAWLLEPYSDRHNHVGNPIMPMKRVAQIALDGLEHGFQVCSHAIGDRANREVLNAYEAAFVAKPDQAKDHRYRIEHAQHLHPEDIPRFADLGVIASMQAIHMSSDRPWAIDRLGKERIESGAYVWRSLLDSGAKVINGTDAPVEPVNPIACYYASVSRKTLAGTPEEGYESAQRMTREEALKSYTLDAAYGAFEEGEKGSVEVGKWGDFTVLSQDILTVPEKDLLKTEIEYTIVGGNVVYSKR
ncbi:MAG: amidohydrolase [Bacteroidota bacterium]